MQRLAWRLIKKKLDHWIFGKLVDQLRWGLEKELLGKVDSVLDLGCGSRSRISYFKQQIKRTVGVDLFKPSLSISRERKLHH